MKKRNLLVIAIAIAMLVLLVGCSADTEGSKNEGEWELVSEKQILSVKIETRPITNGAGGVKRHAQYLVYCYVDENGTVGFDEHQLFENYDYYSYEVIFEYPSEENKVVEYKWSGFDDETRYHIYLTEDKYEGFYTNAQNEVDVK